ncbi:MAG: 3'-5' exoribonuclease [Amphritea sp.]|nr:3'-5' exoribonuclease [Amphritea sp.]
MTKHIMIDIETLGTKPGSVILSIGAVEFDEVFGTIRNQFYSEINTLSCIDFGMRRDEETLKWWQEQGEEAKALLTRCEDPNAMTVDLALRNLHAWLINIAGGDLKKIKVWANSPSFDLDILAEAFSLATELKTPWLFYNELDCRTAVELGRMMGIDPKREIEFAGVKHDALDDAKHQARYVSHIISHIKRAEPSSN